MTTRKNTEQNTAETPNVDRLSGLATGNLGDFVAYHLHQFQLALTKYSEATAQHLGMERSYVRLLLLVDANPGAAQGRIAKAMNLERSSIVPVIDRLEYDGYLERRQHVADSRSKALWLTKKGTRMVTKIKTLIDRAESEIFAGFSPQERTLLIGLMQRATDNLHAMISRV